LLTGASFVLTGQQFTDRYAPLIRALTLNDTQITQLQQPNRDHSILDPAQQFKLAEIAKVLQRYQTSAAAVVLGLIDVREWPPGGWPCGLYPIPAYEKEFGLSADQVTQFQQLENTARQPLYEQVSAKQKRHGELMESGGKDSPEGVALVAEISKLGKQLWDTRPPREAALALLNDEQRAKLTTFQTELDIAREAVELNLIRVPGVPEALCH
jgi:hypothetical protein